MNLEFVVGLLFINFRYFFYGLKMTKGCQLNHSLSLSRLLKPFFDNVLLEHDGLPHVLPLAVHLDFRDKPKVQGPWL